MISKILFTPASSLSPRQGRDGVRGIKSVSSFMVSNHYGSLRVLSKFTLDVLVLRHSRFSKLLYLKGKSKEVKERKDVWWIVIDEGSRNALHKRTR